MNEVSAMATRPAAPSTREAREELEPQRQAECEHELHVIPEDALRIAGPLTLLDGRRVHVRAIQPDDGRRVCAFHARLSPETKHLRYFGAMAILSDEAARHLADIDYERRMAVVATTIAEVSERSESDEQHIIAIVGYEGYAPAGSSKAEVTFVVDDRWQGLGIATQLLYVLAAYARRHGIVTLIAKVMPGNVRMLGVLRHCGFPYAQYENGCVEVHLDIAAPPIPW